MNQTSSPPEQRVDIYASARRFGSPLPAWVAERMASANDEQLLLWGERVLDAATLDDVFSAQH